LRELKRLAIKQGRITPLLALDVENASKETRPENPNGAFLCASVYGDIRLDSVKRVNGKLTHIWGIEHVEEHFQTQEAFAFYLSSLPANSCQIVTYNLSYDRVFFDAIIDHESIIKVESRIIMLKIKANGIKVSDLFNHTMQGTLENWIGYLNMKEKYGVEKLPLSQLAERNKQDTKATYYLGKFIQDFYNNECHCPMRLTVGSTVLRLFQMHFFNDYWYRTDAQADFFSPYERKAYYGGRVEMFKRGQIQTWAYDINSTYVSIMRDVLLPDPSTARYIEGDRDWQKHINEHDVIADVTIDVPADLYIPVLPVHMGGKLKFPTGIIRGTYCKPEILLALEKGCKLVQVHSFIWYRQSKPYFKAFAEFIWVQRLKFKGDKSLSEAKGMDSLVKRVGNALYGKFAERHSNEYFGRASDYTGDIPVNARFIDYESEVFLSVPATINEPAKHEFPCISAFITSYARCKLYRAMDANEKTLIYVDTDCLKLDAPQSGLAVGKDLGEWGLEASDISLIYHRAKYYGDKHKGVPTRAVKAVPDNPEAWGKLNVKQKAFVLAGLGECFVFDKPLRYNEAIRSKKTPNLWVEMVKQLEFLDDKRIWENNISKPIDTGAERV
jgi:hypothetical protein